MRSNRPALALAFSLLLPACAPAPAPESPPVTPAASSASAAHTPAPPAIVAPAEPPRAAAGKPCGALECRLFDAPEDALRVVLAGNPLVLGIGEAHAQKGMEGVESAARRFTTRLLPVVGGRASDLVVELMLPPRGCKPAEQQVREQQKEVTRHQAESNQSEYVTMGDAARKLGVIPDALRPTCADLDRAARAGDGAIAVMLENIARLAGAKARELLARNEKAGAEKMVILYGGALHNDASPAAARAAWSFGPEMRSATKDRYVELDLFVPESIQDTDSWKVMPWVAHYDKAALGGSTVLFKTGPASWVMVFPRTPR